MTTLPIVAQVKAPVLGFAPSPGPAKSLTIKERRFVTALLTTCHGNATKAATAAGYKAVNNNGLRAQACRIRKRPHVQAAIEAALERESGGGMPRNKPTPNAGHGQQNRSGKCRI